MRDFRKYDLWQDAINLVDEIYEIVQSFPESEKYVLVSQITRSAVSIPSNIAEGSSRESEKDFARFVLIALGSAYELETQLLISKRRSFITKEEYIQFVELIQSIQKRLIGLKKKLS